VTIVFNEEFNTFLLAVNTEVSMYFCFCRGMCIEIIRNIIFDLICKRFNKFFTYDAELVTFQCVL
jgi:hypothetical protein